MSLKDPRAYPMREFAFFEHFTRRRVAALSSLVTPAVLDELERNPKGQKGDQSDALSQVLNFVRANAPMKGRPYVHVEEPHRAYRLARMRGRGRAPELVPEGPRYATEEEAVAAAIRDRLQIFGLPAKGGAA